MKKLIIEPGACRFTTVVEAEGEGNKRKVNVKVESMCPHVQAMSDAVGSEVNPIKVCLAKPGTDPYSRWAQEPENNFPPHACCPAIVGIIKAIEAESGLGLPRPTQICFVDEETDDA